MKHIKSLNLDKLDAGIHKFWFYVTNDALGNDISIPLIIIKSKKKGPVFLNTALVHGDELNGLETIHKLLDVLEKRLKKGTYIALPVFNVPGFLNGERYFSEGIDLNHQMPGNPKGKNHSIYIYKIMNNIVFKADYVLDLHTARKRSRNTYYVRADLRDKDLSKMASLLNANIILDHVPSPTTLRGACAEKGIKALTLELGDPMKYQKKIVNSSISGVLNMMHALGMVDSLGSKISRPIVCSSSYRISANDAGIVEIYPNILDVVKSGQEIGNIKDIFGRVNEKIYAEEKGIIIGKADYPIVRNGMVLAHIGKISKNLNT